MHRFVQWKKCSACGSINSLKEGVNMNSNKQSLNIIKSRKKEGIKEMLAWKGEDIFPRELAIETVFGCNLSCEMCFINQHTHRKKGIMPMDLFHQIADSMAPYADKIEQVDLWSLGEPLLDPHIFYRIAYLKEKGFRNIAISTNADLLNSEKRKRLLESRIGTVIFSVDGIKKETHEKIRRGSNFERTVGNIQEIIRMRDEGNYPTRFIVRFIRNEDNASEWEGYKSFWNSKLSQERRDFVSRYDTHNYGGLVADKDMTKLKDVAHPDSIESLEKRPCHFVFDALIILSDGSLALCPADFLHAKFGLGKIPETAPLEAFNSKAYKQMRETHKCGRKNDIKLCKDCTILYCETTGERGWEVEENKPSA